MARNVNVTEERVELTAIDKATQVVNQVRASYDGLRSSVDSVKAAFAGFGVALSAGAAAAWIKGAIDMEASLLRISRAAGTTVEGLSSVTGVAKRSNTDLEQVATGLQKLSKSMAEAGDGTSKAGKVFDALGISLTTSSGAMRSTQDVMQELGVKLRGMRDQTLAVAFAQEVLGKSGANLLPFLYELAEAGTLSAKVTTQQALAAKQFNDNLELLSRSGSALKISIANDVLPMLIELTDKLIKAKSATGGLASALATMATAKTGNGGADIDQRISEIDAQLAYYENNRSAQSVAGLFTFGLSTIGMGVDEGRLVQEREYLLKLRPQPGKATEMKDWMEPGPAATITNPLGKDSSGRELDETRRLMAEDARNWVHTIDELERGWNQLTYTWDVLGDRVTLTREEVRAMQEDEKRVMESWVETAKISTEISDGMVSSWDAAGNRISMTRAEWDVLDKMEKDAQAKMQADFKATSESVQRTLSTAIVTGFMNGGRNGGEVLKRALEATMATLILEPLLKPILAPIGAAAASLAGSLWGPAAGGAAGGAAGATAGAGAAAAYSWAPPIAAVAGTYAAYQSGVANKPIPLFGKVGNAIDSVFPGLGTALGMGGNEGAQYTVFLRRGADGKYFLQTGDDGGQSIVQRFDTGLDPSMIGGMQQWEQGGHGESLETVIGRIMSRLAPAILPDINSLTGQQDALYQSLISAASPERLGINTLQSYQQALSVSEFAGGPTDRLASARSIYDSTLARARGGDLSAINQFPQVAQQLLGIGRDVYASGGGFQDLFVDVNRALTEVLDQQRKLQADVLKDVPATIQQASIDQVKAIRDQTTELSDQLRAVQEELRRVRGALAA
jgi:hypothetical protein